MENKLKIQIPPEFKKVIVDMTKDILISFPEQEANMHKELKNLVFETDPETLDNSLKYVFIHCKTIYPTRFFDILYQTNTIFESDKDLQFLPGINFITLWKENISEKTRETIWKYLQLVLFTIVSSISDGNSFGDTAKLFEAINEDDFKSKLEETIKQMHTLFGESTGASAGEAGTGTGASEAGTAGASEADTTSEAGTGASKAGINLEDLPNPSDIHEHVTNMMNGKLGKLAREIAEETASDLNINMENAESINDVFKRLIKNPTKLLSLVKNVGSKLDEKLKSGDMKESELLEEASELMKKMKNMPGMGDLQSMLSKMGMNPGKGGGKVNVNAMQTNLDKKLKEAKNRERLMKNMEKKRAEAAAAAAAAASASTKADVDLKKLYTGQTEPIENLVFSTGETVERSTPSDKKKKKNNKK
jgi:hypothetical protein